MKIDNTLWNRYLRAETSEEEEQEIRRLMDENVPHGLEERLSRAIDEWNRVEKTTERRSRVVLFRWVSGVAAVLLILFAVTFRIYRQTTETTERAITAFSQSIDLGLEKLAQPYNNK